jgi:inhibitor of KinA
MNYPYKIFPLGDSALTIDFGNKIEEQLNNEVIGRFHQLSVNPIPGTTEMIPAYSSLTIHYDAIALKKNLIDKQTVFEYLQTLLKEKLGEPLNDLNDISELIKIPVCYDPAFATDLEKLCEEKNMDRDELIAIHTTGIYRIYMLGFLPGFAYMGEVDERIATPRKQQPTNVTAGSVGIAGKQTGIYPLDSPGGWQIIGRTPWKLFDPGREEPVLLKAGDRVQFYSIRKEEF